MFRPVLSVAVAVLAVAAPAGVDPGTSQRSPEPGRTVVAGPAPELLDETGWGATRPDEAA